jgi:hypothetical protein
MLTSGREQTQHIVKQLATMLADWRLDIRSNMFCPGVYPSDMSKVHYRQTPETTGPEFNEYCR